MPMITLTTVAENHQIHPQEIAVGNGLMRNDLDSSTPIPYYPSTIPSTIDWGNGLIRSGLSLRPKKIARRDVKEDLCELC